MKKKKYPLEFVVYTKNMIADDKVGGCTIKSKTSNGLAPLDIWMDLAEKDSNDHICSPPASLHIKLHQRQVIDAESELEESILKVEILREEEAALFASLSDKIGEGPEKLSPIERENIDKQIRLSKRRIQQLDCQLLDLKKRQDGEVDSGFLERIKEKQKSFVNKINELF